VKYLILVFFSIMCFACTTVYEVPCKSGHGYLYKNEKEFVCPFEILKLIGSGEERRFIVEEKNPTILADDVGEYFPLKRRNAPFAYNLSMSVPKEYFTEEQYTVSLWTENINFKPCGEAKETIFYKVTENDDFVEYRSYILGEVYTEDYGKKIFFGSKEMPSYDWYHVLKVCDGSFYIKGEIINE